MQNKILKALFSSGSRVDILSYFFLNPGVSFYARQMEKLLKKPVSQIRRELINLESAGVLTSLHDGSQKKYSLNISLPIYDDLKNIFLKSLGANALFKPGLYKIKGLKLAFIYGSYADGTAGAKSDIDLMLAGALSEKDALPYVSALEKSLKRPVNPSIYSVPEIKKRLAKNDNFIKTVFNGPKIVLKGNVNEILGAD